MTPPLRVLCIDHEGGHGGSSRSLHYMLREVDQAQVRPEVWCRRAGPMEAAYDRLGITCQIEPELYSLSALPRTLDNAVEYPRFLHRFYRSGDFLQRLLAAVETRFDVVHFNYEGLWWLAHWLRRRSRRALVMHIRSRPKNTILARWQAASISRNMDELIFIYGVVKTHFCELGGADFGETIFNVPSVNDGSGLHPGVPEDDRLKVASLSNYHYLNKATDRLIDVAQALSQRGRADILFVIAGDMTLNRRLPGRLGEIGAGGGTLGDYAAERGVADYFLFLGHVKDPESVLNACGALVRVARTKDPWGRDVIEALSFGLPVVTISAGEGFVVDGRNGIVHDEFHPDRFAGALLQLADNQALRRSLGTAGKAEISQLCDGPSRAADMVRVWQTAWESRAA